MLKSVLKIIIFYLVLGLAACSEPVDDKSQIRARVAAMETASEARDLSAALEPVHDSFVGNKRISKPNLRGLLLLNFRQNKNVHVLVNGLDIIVDKNAKPLSANVKCNLALAGRDGSLPKAARVLQVESVWQKHGDEWFVVSASWRDPLVDWAR